MAIALHSRSLQNMKQLTGKKQTHSAIPIEEQEGLEAQE